MNQDKDNDEREHYEQSFLLREYEIAFPTPKAAQKVEAPAAVAPIVEEKVEEHVAVARKVEEKVAVSDTEAPKAEVVVENANVS